MGTIIGAKTCTWQLKLTLGLLEITGQFISDQYLFCKC